MLRHTIANVNSPLCVLVGRRREQKALSVQLRNTTQVEPNSQLPSTIKFNARGLNGRLVAIFYQVWCVLEIPKVKSSVWDTIAAHLKKMAAVRGL